MRELTDEILRKLGALSEEEIIAQVEKDALALTDHESLCVAVGFMNVLIEAGFPVELMRVALMNAVKLYDDTIALNHPSTLRHMEDAVGVFKCQVAGEHLSTGALKMSGQPMPTLEFRRANLSMPEISGKN